MPYSLVSAATLGFDLVRLPAGREVADVLLTALEGDGAELNRMAAAHPARSASPERRGVLAVRSRRARELAVAVPQMRTLVPAPDGSAEQRTAVLVAQLERGTIGDVITLERLLRDDVLGPEHPAHAELDADEFAAASDVLADAAVGAWATDVLPPLVRRELVSPWEQARAASAPQVDLGPATDELRALLTALRTLDGAGRERWRNAVDEGRSEQRPWAGAMHGASWAAHVSGRTRILAAAQLHAVRAFLDGGFDARDGAHGVWNAVAGIVQGIAMADLLDESALAVLRAPWVRVTTR